VIERERPLTIRSNLTILTDFVSNTSAFCSQFPNFEFEHTFFSVDVCRIFPVHDRRRPIRYDMMFKN